LPGSWKEVKKILSSIGMEYQIVHACVNDYMLFHGNNAHLTNCELGSVLRLLLIPLLSTWAHI